MAAELGVPMLWILEESQGERPADTEWQKFWFQAGAAHAPLDWEHYVWRSDMRDLGQHAPLPDAVNAGCSINRGEGYAVRSGIHGINRWVRGLDGSAEETGPGNGADRGRGHGHGRAPDEEPNVFIPPSAPRLERDESGELIRDEDGHALGGIRYPYIEAPVALNTSEGCPLFGSYEPFSSDEILARYPTDRDYESQVETAADAAIQDGFLLADDKKKIMADAEAFDVWTPGAALCHDLRGPIERLYHESPLQPCPPGAP